ncbi:MAG TPA: PQQ-binding-like beta-propeller repeat protein [Draconibacterium sp.]|nr:PQQ-binding-like beta-propeller repeat protein [Draconibacterium sp.]
MSTSNNQFYKETKVFYAVALIGLLLSFSCTSESKFKISEWRGPGRSGIYSETNLLNEWPGNGPEILWVAEGLGKGYASPSISEKLVFVNGEQDSTSFLFAFDLLGELLWKSPNGKEFMGEGFSSTYPGSRSTPTVVNDLVYTSSGKGRIACFEASSGTEKWAVDIIDDLGGRESEFGYSESLLVDENNVYCFVGGEEINMAAFDRFSGNVVWSSEALKDTFSYCSPIFVELPNRKVIVTHSRHYIFAVDCENGETLGSYGLDGYEWDGEHCNSPIYSDGFIYFIGNDEKGKGAIKLEISKNGENLNEIWYNSIIRNNFNGYVKIANGLFTTVKGNWMKKLNINDGLVSDSIKIATGSLIFADNKFISYGMNGDVNLIHYKNDKLNVASTFKVKEGDGHHFAHPVIANGILYIRHGDALMAYKIK